MKTTSILAVLAAVAPLSEVEAYPGMAATIRKVEQIAARQSQWNAGSVDGFDPHQMLGDLRTLPDNQLSLDGRTIKMLLQGQGSPESTETYVNPPTFTSPQCKQDTCCVWKYISDELAIKFGSKGGRCTKFSRFAVRIGFHDAGSWSLATEKEGGGADGSIILANELLRGENQGLSEIGAYYTLIYNKYRAAGFQSVTMADLIQMGAAIGAVSCPGGPRVRSWVGRKDSTTPAREGLLPSAFADAESLIQLFKDKTIGPQGLIALLGAHTTSQQNYLNLTRGGDPQDSTPGVWDVKYYSETLGGTTVPERVMMFPSDLNLANHPVTKPTFQLFAGTNGQSMWNEDYAFEYIRLSLLGVNNINTLKECTKVLPAVATWNAGQDKAKVDKWLSSDDNSYKTKQVSKDIEEGKSISVGEGDIPVTHNNWRNGRTSWSNWSNQGGWSKWSSQWSKWLNNWKGSH